MNYNETLSYIHSLGRFKYEKGLSRITEVLAKLGNPQDNIKCIHIAGTNGKGSTCVYISEILKSAGYKTGLYISPFIVDFRERIQIGGEYISESNLIKHSKAVIDTGVALNEFEFITAVMFSYFCAEKVDVAVIETGLGGRYDATNVISNLLVAVITKIGLDHTALLGDTIEEIANEKCGIIKGNIPVVTIANQDKKALKIIKESTNNLTLPNTPEIIKSDIFGNTFIYKDNEYTTTLAGVHQVFNAITAIETVLKTGFAVKNDDIYLGLKNAVFPARLEVISKNPLIVIDGAHNPDGANVLSEFLDNYGNDFVCIVGMMKDKNTDGFLKRTIGGASKVILTEIESQRCMKAEELKETAVKYNDNIIVETDTKKALLKAKEFNLPIFVFGSLYIASNIRKTLINNNI